MQAGDRVLAPDPGNPLSGARLAVTIVQVFSLPAPPRMPGFALPGKRMCRVRYDDGRTTTWPYEDIRRGEATTDPDRPALRQHHPAARTGQGGRPRR
ncbi:hypothetical protein FSW04_18855 [Baekduia soli]|uniref:Uncharacterized protein n=1 Tax=Baekduia soli TaxID=496014 RepID=A0A5B8U8Z0_9ACTN|nr:hypothetical protein [Baekduia soli]QEC49427.1 hypothetical protein FSW04_18855 [Baekduia soli]